MQPNKKYQYRVITKSWGGKAKHGEDWLEKNLNELNKHITWILDTDDFWIIQYQD